MQNFPVKLFTWRVNKVHDTNDNQHDNNCDINGSSYHNYYNQIRSNLDLIIFFAIFLVFIFVVVPLVVQYDQPSVPEFQIESLMVTSMKVYNNSKDYYSIVQDETHITADLDITLTLKNKDQGLIYFDPMQVSLEYHQDELLSSSLEAFLLDEYQHQLHFRMQIKDDAHLRNKTMDSISQDLWSKNVVQFALKAKGHYVRWHRIYVDKCDIKLVCEDIKVGFSPANNLTTGSLIVSPVPCNGESVCMHAYY